MIKLLWRGARGNAGNGQFSLLSLISFEAHPVVGFGLFKKKPFFFAFPREKLAAVLPILETEFAAGDPEAIGRLLIHKGDATSTPQNQETSTDHPKPESRQSEASLN